MKYFQQAVSWLFDFKGRLFTLHDKEDEPLTKLSIVVILILDVFLFAMIYQGVSEQSLVVEIPEQFAGYECRDMVNVYQDLGKKDQEFVIAQKLYSTSNYEKTRTGYSNFYDYNNYSIATNTSPDCQSIATALTQVDNDNSAQILFGNHYSIQERIMQIETKLSSLRGNYDTKLLEKIANQSPELQIDPETANTTKSSIDQLVQERQGLESDLRRTVNSILTNTSVMEIQKIVESRGAEILIGYNYKSFWYPAKKLGVESLFLIPLLIVVLWWSNRSLAKRRTYQLLISSHLLAIIGIFIVLKIITFIYDIIPKVLLTKLIAWLSDLEIIGVFYYILILIGVLTTLAIVYIVQRRVKAIQDTRRAEIGAKHAEKGECWSCGAHLLDGATHCIRCGEGQMIPCPSCKKSTPLAAEHCMHCGKSL